MQHIVSADEDFTVVAYSVGCVIAMEVLALLEEDGIVCKNAVFIDGSTEVFSEMLRTIITDEDESKRALECKLIFSIMSHFLPREQVLQHMVSIHGYYDLEMKNTCLFLERNSCLQNIRRNGRQYGPTHHQLWLL